jgi:membrane protein YqaA with SNARE-associated domain
MTSLLVLLVARNHEQFPIYLLTAAAGSTIGVLLLDLVIRRGGAEGLKRLMNQKRVNYLEKRMKQRAALALVIACLAPPPFPFTAVIAAASAFQFPKMRLLAIVFGARWDAIRDRLDAGHGGATVGEGAKEKKHPDGCRGMLASEFLTRW